MSRSDVTLRCHAGGHTRRDPVGYATDQDFFENDQICSRFQKFFRQSIPLAKLRRSIFFWSVCEKIHSLERDIDVTLGCHGW